MKMSADFAADAKAPVLSIQGVSKSFGSHQVLSDVTLSVAGGETVCLLGPSGSGKSTLLRCINWLDPPDHGRILLAGQTIGVQPGSSLRSSDRELAEIRTHIGMVFQHFALWPHLSVLDNLTVGPIHVQRREPSQVREEAHALLKKVGLSEKADAFPARLSGGQKQRVGIARALAMRPTLLLFDEPTSALDPELVGEVLDVMRDLVAEGMTMLVVTHEMAFAREAADRIVFLDHGRVIETNTSERFFDAPETDRVRQFLTRSSSDATAKMRVQT
jgi:polar amino acid transport system ATP-binding protein